jgi:hypothetical protein
MEGNAFRSANRRIADKARQLGVRGEIPFICECAERGCFRTIRYRVSDYERLVSEPGRFLVLPGHPHPRPGVNAAA